MDTKMLYGCKVSFLGSITAAFLVLIALLMPAYAGPGDISTVAGGYIGDGGPATSARLNNPAHIAVDAAGKVYIVDTYNQRIRMVSSGTITTVAGNGTSAYAGDGGLATAASINEANGVAVDAAGNIYIADSFNQRIRKVDAATKIINTVAGTGSLGIGSHTGDPLPATASALFYPYSVATNTAGTVFYIADSNNHRIRRVSGGTMSTVVGSSTASFGGDGFQAYDAYVNYPTDVALDSTGGNLYIADTNNHRIRKVNIATNIITTIAGNGTAGFSGDGGPAINASLNAPYGVAVDTAGNVYIADMYNNRIRKVDTSGNISTVVGSGSYDYSGDGGAATSAGLRFPSGVAVDGSGNIYISDQFNDCTRKVTGGIISTIAGSPVNAYYGNNGPATAASLNYAHGVGADASGNVYIADTKNNRIRKVTPGTPGTITTAAGDGNEGSGGDGGSALLAQLNNPYGVTADASGNIYIADSYNHRIRKVDASSGNINTVAGDGTTAVLNGPRGVALDKNGNLYIADTDNHRVRKVTYPAGTISTIAGTGTGTYNGDNITAATAALNTPTAVAIDAGGNIYIADSGNNRIRKILVSTGTGTGNIITVAGNGTFGYSGDGGSPTSAQLSTPYGVAVDAVGTIYIADFYNSKIRKVAANIISTVVGNGIPDVPYDVPIDVFLGFAGDGQQAAPTGYSILNNPYSVAVDPAGNVYFADVNNLRVRKISESAPPTLSTVHIFSSNATTTRAKSGDTVTLTITASEPLTAPTVTIAGHTATVTGSAASWSANTVMTGSEPQGLVSFSIAYRDISGNTGASVSTVTDGSSVTVDSIAPTVTISTTASNPTRTSPIPVTVVFSETVTGFVSGDVTLGNGSISGFTIVSGTTYTFSVIPSAQGAVTVDVAAGVALDPAANGNTAATQLSRTYDNTAPSVTISTTASNPTRTSPIPVTVVFSETVTGFAIGDVTVGNGNISLFTAVSGTTYTFSVTPNNGVVTVDIAAGVALDAAGNGNTAAAQLRITFDNVAPTMLISAPSSTLTRTGPVTYTVTYSGADTVTLANANVTLNTSGTATGTVVSSGTGTASRTVTISGITGDGTLGISIAAATASDLAGNTTLGGSGTAFGVDNTAPTVTISTTASNPTRTSPIPVSVVFSETVTGFTSGDVTIGNGTISLFTAVSGTTYTFSVTPSAQGAVTVDVAAGVAQDAAAFGNTAATQLSRTYDSVAPTMLVSAPSSTLARSGPVAYTVTYSGADSVNLATGNVTLIKTGTANGTVSAAVSGSTGTVTISGITGDGALGISIAAGTASDLAGNTALGGSGTAFGVDNTAPTMTISAPSSAATRTGPVTYTVTYAGADTTNLTTGNVTLNKTLTANGTVGVSGAGNTWTVSISGITGDGILGISIAAGTASDQAGNTAAGGSGATFVVDNTAPTILTLSSSASQTTNTSPIPVTVKFSESVTGFGSGGVTVINGSAGAVAGSGADYTFSVTPTDNGLVTITINASAAQDAAGNGNTASASSLTRVFDSVQPTVVISSSILADHTNASSIPVTVTFSKSVTGFTIAGVNVTNGSKGSFAGSGTTYTLIVTPTAQGPVTVNVAAGVAQDVASNGNLAAVPLVKTYDTIAPTAVISSTAPNSTNLSPIPMTVTFSETVTGFTSGNVTIGNGTIVLFTAVSGTTYTFNVAPTAEGAVTVNVAAGMAQDLAGNSNVAAAPLARTYDGTQPTVTINSIASNQTRTSPIPVLVTFSEPVTGFTVTSMTVTNGTTGSFLGSGTTYNFNVIPLANGPVTVNIAAGVAHDLAGNGNGAALQLTRTYDTVAPTLVISAPSLTVANKGAPVTYTVTYAGADAVTLAAGEVTLNKTGDANGSVSVTGAGTNSRTITVSNITGFNGTLGISIAAGTASDLAGNMSSPAGASGTFTMDNGSGDLNGDGAVTSTDALKALQIASGIVTPSAADIAHGDVAPVANGNRTSDGKIDLADVVAILKKIVGSLNW